MAQSFFPKPIPLCCTESRQFIGVAKLLESTLQQIDANFNLTSVIEPSESNFNGKIFLYSHYSSGPGVLAASSYIQTQYCKVIAAKDSQIFKYIEPSVSVLEPRLIPRTELNKNDTVSFWINLIYAPILIERLREQIAASPQQEQKAHL